MITMSRRILYMVLGGMIALVLVGVAVIGGTAVFAQDETPTPPPAEETVPTFPGNGPRPDFQRGGFADQGSYLADALGITVEELQAAREAVRTTQMESAVAQALADGQITQEQADAMLAGQSFGRGRHGMRGLGTNIRDEHEALLAAQLGISVETLTAAQETAQAAAQAQAIADGLITQEQADLMGAGQILQNYIDHDTTLANLLGISVAELTAAKQDRSIHDLITASGLTQEEIMTAMQTARETAVAQAVADGVITQAQADQLQTLPGQGNMNGMRGGWGNGGGMHGEQGQGDQGRGGSGGPCNTNNS